MPSPFPGMDPYIEDRSIWPDMHSSLIPYIREALQPQVQPKYVARIGERIEIAGFGSEYIPDVMVVEPSTSTPTAQIESSTLTVDEPIVFSFLDEERPVPYLEIIHLETGDVVTVIEVLSPSNKAGEERRKYLEKQANILASHTNFVEIDLLSYGRPTTLARNAPITTPADWRYMICVSRASKRKHIETYPIPLSKQLPRFNIPLRPADPDVVLDLPAIFNRCYDVGAYQMIIDYSKPPKVTLSEAETKWLDQQLIDAGLRVPTS